MQNAYYEAIKQKIRQHCAKLWYGLCALPFMFAAAYHIGTLPRSEKPRLVWGPNPLISNAYWSCAMKQIGYESTTLMSTYFEMLHNREDYDLYYEDIIQEYEETIAYYAQHSRLFGFFKKSKQLKNIATGHGIWYYVFIYALRHYDIFHHHFIGGFLGYSVMWRCEAYLLGLAGKKSILIPFGGDAQIRSQMLDPCIRHVLADYYPVQAREEDLISAKVRYWTKHADIMNVGIMIDGIGRWDVLPYNNITIDTALWEPRVNYSDSDGYGNTSVKIMHTPNHRCIKGTEFLLQAVEELREEGLNVEMILIEKRKNTEVRELLQNEADILVEQFIGTGYALSGIEGMASGVTTMSNMEGEIYLRVFRRYTYLNECPIFSTTAETIKERLRVLVTNPQLRETLGRAGRHYVEKYHSNEAAQYMFSSTYEKIWYGKEIDLMNIFNPLKSEYMKSMPKVQHPLKENLLVIPERSEALV